ncbi:MAG: hypothetical protein Q7W16_00405 [Coriobacteriia bacterium]|nr:hypothetical protein [Coriobacteriia bacterium]
MPILEILFVAIIVIGSILVAVGIPAFFGLMAYDTIQSRKSVALEEKEARRRVTVQRGTARAFVLAGGVFWSVASLAGLYSFRVTGANEALIAAFFPLVACAATLVVGWYYERVTAAALLLASLAVVTWGVIYQFDPGAWLLVTVALVGPMLTASVLFWLARVDQEAYEAATSVRLELAPVFAARSTLARVRAAA